MATPHIEANKGDVAKIVLMPGDPLRAKFIANKYLKNVKQINGVRNMLMFTGTYNGTKITIAGSGMGMPSIGIYAYELYDFYDVEVIIRIGSAGSFLKELKLYQVVLAKESWTKSSFATDMLGKPTDLAFPSARVNQLFIKQAKALNIDLNVTRVLSEDVFYNIQNLEARIAESQSSCAEMESFALFCVAKRLKKEAACLLTISDNLATNEATSASERQESFTKMMELALKTAENL